MPGFGGGETGDFCGMSAGGAGGGGAKIKFELILTDGESELFFAIDG